ncbi:MAG: hypothetical protein HC896_16865 [Bacteroidales bacterium]|nr:hypothetical protein [Bacteroidales bacterium]
MAAMPIWKSNGLLSFTINLQEAAPWVWHKNWINSAYTASGELKPAYMQRLERILNAADSLQMVPIVGLFYFGQDHNLKDEAAVLTAVENAINWLMDKGYRNILIETANEIDVHDWHHDIFSKERAHELIEKVKSLQRNGFRYPVGVSYAGGNLPGQKVASTVDYLLLHGNGVNNPEGITKQIDSAIALVGNRTIPIVYNEDDHFNFDQEDYNLKRAVEKHVSWGYFDYRMAQHGETAYEEGFQSVPVDWGINSVRKKAFLASLKRLHAGQTQLK